MWLRKYVRVVQNIYKDSMTAVKCVAQMMDGFKVKVGLYQVSALSLFFLVCNSGG